MKQLNLSEKVGALFFLLLSGSYAFVDIKYVMLYLVISFIIFILNKGYNNWYIKQNFLITVILAFWATFTTQIIRNDAIDNTFLLYVLYPMANFFLLSSYTFKKFRTAVLIMISYINSSLIIQ